MRATLFKTLTPDQKNTLSTPSKSPYNNTKTKSLTVKHANDPNYEYDITTNRWRKKSDLRPIELVNRYKAFLRNHLTSNSNVDPKVIEKIVHTHATSTKRLKEMIVKKGILREVKANIFFKKNSFWRKELCNHMKKVCPTETDLSGDDWCSYAEEALLYNKDPKTKIVSCYSASDIILILSNSFTGDENGNVFLQPPRDPYTRKVLPQHYVKKMLKLLRVNEDGLSKLAYPHVIYFFRHYKRFYRDPTIKPLLTKSTLTKKEKWELSEAIEDFLTETDEIRHGWAKGHEHWWFWKSGKKPADIREYIFHDTTNTKTKQKTNL